MRLLREAEEEVLSRNGYHPCAAASAGEALARTAIHTPDVIVTRYTLSDSTGPELIQAMREIGVYAPAVGVVGLRVEAEAFVAAGARAVLTMPFGMRALLDAIDLARG